MDKKYSVKICIVKGEPSTKSKLFEALLEHENIVNTIVESERGL